LLDIWYRLIYSLSITVDIPSLERELGTGAIGIDIGCKSALAITDGENHYFVEAPKFLRSSEAKTKHASKAKSRKRAPNRKSKVKASRRWKKASNRVSKITRKVANQRQDWVHQVATEITRSNSRALNAPRFANVATEKLEVKKMTSKANKGSKRKRQKAGLNKSILDVGFGMLKGAIKYKVSEGGGQFIEVPTKKVKPSQTCLKCGHQHPKTLDERVHQCRECGYQQDRDVASAVSEAGARLRATVCLYWVLGTLLGQGTCLVDADGSSSTGKPKVLRSCCGYQQLAQKKRQKLMAQRNAVE